ncbi:hypothetical protein LUZ63_017289 [Rhynchospora breviuscula]|uniref:Uncharacterized protein n=1 Tax=Rhynchospora breviuscula TaxID=2022672 RepID=A0A9Q0C281_9POAL|nr:hypothetical protein LUZ63_017289 [Rhynchospora breviuscula]
MATSFLMRQQSIEFEPRTLTLEEINCAREAALYVLSTTTPEKAISIFTEGLKPVLNAQKDDEDDDSDYYSDCEEENFDCGCCMRCHADCLRVRDIATAPF